MMNRTSIRAVFTAVTLLLAPTLWAGQPDSYDYNLMFDYVRQLLTRAPVRAFLKSTLSDELTVPPEIADKLNLKNDKLKDMSEAQLMLLLKQNPSVFDEISSYLKEVPAELAGTEKENEAREKWRTKFKELLKDPETMKDFSRLNNPIEPMLLETPDKKPGYRNLKIYFTHARKMNGKILPPDDLVRVWVDFIKGAKKQYIGNVFDFNLTEVADALVDAAKRGVDTTQGIDQNVAKTSPEVAEIVKKLEAGGVKVHLVDSVGLNHQKTAARDWEIKGFGAAVFSSGNLTRSCLGPKGDLQPYPNVHSKYSIPNANHMITLDSDIIASLINHELTKTLRAPYFLRGSDYPLSGAYKILGTPYIAGKGHDPYMVVTFTPGGGLGDISQTVIARIIDETEGPIYMMQFAYSSENVENALRARAAREIKKNGKFEHHAIGDGPFALQDWSRFLSESGLKLVKDGDKKTYVPIEDSPWKKTLGKGFAEFQSSIRMPPDIYGNHNVKVDGNNIAVSSKIHHKVIVSGRVTNAGTSFNYSDAAQHNQEQFVVVVDQGIADEMRGAAQYLIENSSSSVAEEALRRNQTNDFEPDVAADQTFAGTKPKAVVAKSDANCVVSTLNQKL